MRSEENHRLAALLLAALDGLPWIMAMLRERQAIGSGACFVCNRREYARCGAATTGMAGQSTTPSRDEPLLQTKPRVLRLRYPAGRRVVVRPVEELG